MKKISQIIIALIIILAIIVGGYFLTANQIKIEKARSYQQGWDAAKTRLYEQIGPMANEGAVSDRLIATVKEINGNQIGVKINSLALLSDPELDNRIVIVGAQTKISEFKMKSAEKYQQELEQYYKDNKIDPKTFVPSPDQPFGPERYEQVSAEIKNIKVGGTIDVYADNINNAKTITAKEIVIKN